MGLKSKRIRPQNRTVSVIAAAGYGLAGSFLDTPDEAAYYLVSLNLEDQESSPPHPPLLIPVSIFKETLLVFIPQQDEIWFAIVKDDMMKISSTDE